jgi:uncharacterized tellurite resistance protein B-like protein
MNAKKMNGSIDGIQSVAEMMNHLDPETRERLLRTLAEIAKTLRK